MPRLSGAIERSFGLYCSSRHARQGQHHLDCSPVSLSDIAKALTNLCWPRYSGRFQMYMLLIYIYIYTYIYIYIYINLIYIYILIFSAIPNFSTIPTIIAISINEDQTSVSLQSCMRDRFLHHATYKW